jgi:hypothetical protein
MSNCWNELSALRQVVQDQQAIIKKLQCQLDFVLSYLDIKNVDTNQLADSDKLSCVGNAPNQSAPELQKNQSTSVDNETSQGQLSWTEVVSRKTKRSDTFQQSVVTAVYVDQTIKKRHETSLIVSGMRPNDTQADASAFAALCNEEFQLQPRIAFTKRLGRSETGRIQPLLVVLKERNQAVQLINSAKVLRRSSNVEVRENVYINPYMTRAEAAAAYRMREQRRLSRLRRANQSIGVSGDNGLTEQVHESGPTMCSPDGVLPQYQSIVNSCNRMTLNPQANTFNPPAPTVAVSD